MSEWTTLDEVAHWWNVPRYTVARIALTGHVRWQRRGRSMVLRASDLRTYADARTHQPGDGKPVPKLNRFYLWLDEHGW